MELKKFEYGMGELWLSEAKIQSAFLERNSSQIQVTMDSGGVWLIPDNAYNRRQLGLPAELA